MAEKTSGDLWSVEKLNLNIGRQVIFQDAEFSISPGDRMALVGRNGCGKSTLLKIIAGLEQPSSGEIAVRRDLRLAMLSQEPDSTLLGSVREVLAGGLQDFYRMHELYNTLDQNSPEHRKIEHQLELYGVWDCDHLLEEMLHKLRLTDPEQEFSQLSGGEKRRVMLGRCLLSRPDLLLLDEPTNHLDINTVEWIEEFLSDYRGSCLLVTHDRYFLDRIANKIIELDHGKFYFCGASYADFLAAKADRIEAEDAETARRKAFLRREIDWVRRSPKARLRRNLGRLRRYDEIAAISDPERTGDVELVIPTPSRLGNKVVNLKQLSLKLGDKMLFDKLDYEFTAGHKVGIVGPNGCGKTSLLKLITGQLAPDSGKVEVAETVEFNYIDQSRLALDPEKSVLEEIAGDLDFVDLGSSRISVWGYLRRFLFEDERINTKIKNLSGGEKARLVLAKILKQGGNFLILDEPTNDLDLPTLRVLEEALDNYPSTVVVVSHDRYFLNRVCNHVMVFEPDGVVLENGDYDYYREHRSSRQVPVNEPEKNKKTEKAPVPQVRVRVAKKLSYAENRELENMESAIFEAEQQLSDIEARFSEPDFFARYAREIPQLQQELDAARLRVETLYARWEELENKKKALAEQS